MIALHCIVKEDMKMLLVPEYAFSQAKKKTCAQMLRLAVGEGECSSCATALQGESIVPIHPSTEYL
jgi:hypothetical protein